jgi:hypothetical protein
MGEIRNAYNILIRNPEEKIIHTIPRRRWER